MDPTLLFVMYLVDILFGLFGVSIGFILSFFLSSYKNSKSKITKLGYYIFLISTFVIMLCTPGILKYSLISLNVGNYMTGFLLAFLGGIAPGLFVGCVGSVLDSANTRKKNLTEECKDIFFSYSYTFFPPYFRYFVTFILLTLRNFRLKTF